MNDLQNNVILSTKGISPAVSTWPFPLSNAALYLWLNFLTIFINSPIVKWIFKASTCISISTLFLSSKSPCFQKRHMKKGKQITVFSRFYQKCFKPIVWWWWWVWCPLLFSCFTLSQAPCFIDTTCYPSMSKGRAGPVLSSGQVHRSPWASCILCLGPVRILISEFKLQGTMMCTACSNMYITDRIVLSCILASNYKRWKVPNFD